MVVVIELNFSKLLACMLASTHETPNDVQALSPAGRCRTFDAAADGYGRGEGFVVAALAPPGSSDNAVGLLRGSAVNQDGRSSSLTAPNGPAQSRLIASALAAAGASTDAVGFVAAHGTGVGP